MTSCDPSQSITWNHVAMAAIVTLTLTGVAAAAIRRPLFAVLTFVCGTDVGARFWTTFSTVLVVFGPTFLVFVSASGTDDMADYVRRAIYVVSAGIVFAFLVMGYAVLRSASGRPAASEAVPTVRGARS